MTCSLVCDVQTAKTLAPLATPDLIPLGASSKTMQFSIALPSFSAPVRYLFVGDESAEFRFYGVGAYGSGWGLPFLTSFAVTIFGGSGH